MNQSNFQKSDMGAQAAWKGFSSQTYYIAARLISDKYQYEYYPEDIEDLVVKKDGVIVEAVQVKNVSATLTLSSLASTKTSTGGEGFFNRMCSIHAQNPFFNNIRRWKRIKKRIKIFRTHIFSENRLPYFAVDPYCLYSEVSSKQPTTEYFPVQQLLSVGKYEKFRKLLNKVYASLDNFFNQFEEVLAVRINKQDINIVKNPRPALYNFLQNFI